MRAAFAALLCLLALAAPATAEPLTSADFAYGCPLPVADGNGLYGLDLPLAVYEKVLRADLGDLRIFNGSGEAVPHAVRRVTAEPAQTRQPVPFFPLPDGRTKQAVDLSLRVTRHADGAVIAVDAGRIASPPASSSALLDTTRLTSRPTGLEVQWTHPASILTVSLQQSADLTHWSPLVDRAVLADLAYGGGQVVARRIPLPEKTLPYLRLDCLDSREPMRLQEVIALAGTPAEAGQWQWVGLTGTVAKGEKGEPAIAYRLPARVTVTALRLGFPAANSLLRATIESRPTVDSPWRQVARADFYRLDLEGATLTNPLVDCPPVSDTEWRLRVIADNAGLLDGNGSLPQLELGWRPHQVLFLGRGQGPYTLAVGSAKATGGGAVQNDLVLAALRDSRAETRLRRIDPGPLHPLAGDRALQPGSSAFPWQKLLLWTVLIGGVALLALMTRTILREMGSKTD